MTSKPVNVDMLPLVRVLLQVTHEVDQVIVGTLRLHVGEALHVLQVPFPSPVPQGLIPKHLLHQHHIGNFVCGHPFHVRVVHITIPQVKAKYRVTDGEDGAQKGSAVGSIIVVQSQL